MKSAKQRIQKFEQRLVEYGKNNQDLQIPGYKSTDPSSSFVLTINSLKDATIPENIRAQFGTDNLRAEFHLTFYYCKEDKFIFFGRTCRSQLIDLSKDRDGTLGFRKKESFFFHTKLNKAELREHIHIVVECVLAAETEYKKKKTLRYSSGGYCTLKAFELGKDPATLSLMEGSPRDLTSLFDKSGKETNTVLTIDIKKFKEFDPLQKLVGENTFVSQHEMIPGLRGDFLPEIKKKVPVTVEKKSMISIHVLSLTTSPKFESELGDFFREQFCEGGMNSRGIRSNKEEIAFRIKELRINVKCHNGWTYITEPTPISLKKKHHGYYSTDSSVQIKDFIPSEGIAVIFELNATVEIQGYQHSQICLGYQIYMPELSDSGTVLERTFNVEMIHGPGENIERELLISESCSPNFENSFEFQMKALISKKAEVPDVTRMRSIEAAQEKLQEEKRMQREREIERDRIEEQKKRKSDRQAFFDRDSSSSYKYSRTVKEPRLNDRYSHEPDHRVIEDYSQFRDTFNDWQENFQNRMEDMLTKQFPTSAGADNEAVSHKQHMLEQQQQMIEGHKREMEKQLQLFQDGSRSLQDMLGQLTAQPGKLQGSRFEGHSHLEMQQIGNVFYNLLNIVGNKNNDPQIIGLSNELRDQLHSKKLSDIFEGNMVIPGVQKPNVLRSVDMSASDQAHLMKEGLADVLHHPTAQILQSSFIKEKLDINLEKFDRLKASDFQIKFMAYKTTFSNDIKVPKKFQFKFKFFTFPETQTQFMSLKYDQTSAGQPKLDPSTPYLLRACQSRTSSIDQSQIGADDIVTVRYEVDPTGSKIPDEHLKFAKYLKDRFLSIDIFDAESMFYFGTTKFPLFETLRQGKEMIVRPWELEIVDTETGDRKGHIHAIFSNVGKLPSVSEDETKAMVKENVVELGKVRRQPSQGKMKKKVVISRPMEYHEIKEAQKMFGAEGVMDMTAKKQTMASTSADPNQAMLDQLTEAQKAASMQDPELRKQLRIERIRKKTLGTQATMGGGTVAPKQEFEDPNQPYWMRQRSLKEIEMIRQSRKDLIINQVMKGYLSEAHPIHLIPGELQFMTITVTNKVNMRQVYKIKIFDPDSQNGDGEVQYVSSPHEIQHWVKAGKVRRPMTYACFNDKDSLVLEAGEEVELLFKFVTYREVALLTQKQSTPNVITQRNVKIEIVGSSSISQVYDCNLVPISPPIDQVFRYYEPENSYFKVKIPKFTVFGRQGPNVKTSRPNVFAEIDSRSSEIFVQSKTGKAMTQEEFFIYVYEDDFQTELLAVCKVEVNAMTCVYSNARAGVQNALSLQFMSNDAREIEIHSSSEANVFLPKKNINKKVPVVPHQMNCIQLCTQTFQPGTLRSVVHAIDDFTGKVIHSWLIVLMTMVPKPDKQEEIKVKANTLSRQRLPFTNKYNRPLTLEFASSHPRLLEPESERLYFGPKEQQMIDLKIYAQPEKGTMTTYVYISDIDQYVMECVELEIMYY